jgi:hypothetical protein
LVLANSPDAADAADAAESTDSTDEALMSRFLDDASPLGVYLSRGVVIKSELRDVALAAIIRRSGADPRQFGFQYVKPGATFLYSPATLGFSDSPQREAAFAQWAQRHTP